MKNYLKYVVILPFIIISFTYNLMKPSALTTETIYSDLSSNCTLSNSNKYKNISSNGTLSNNNINTTFQGKSYGMSFAFEEPMVNTKVYELKITFMSNDLLPKVNQNYLLLTTYNTTCDSDYATILSIEKNTNSGNATTLTISFIPEFTSSKARLIIGSDTAPVVITGETTFGIKSVQIGDRDAQGNEDIIINNNQNTQNIINNQEQNTQNIIDNQNQNTQDLIDSNKVCNKYDKANIKTANSYLNSTGGIYSSDIWGITDYISIDSNSELKITQTISNSSVYYCFYNVNKSVISCNTLTNFNNITIPNNASYLRVSIHQNYDAPQFEVCRSGNQAVSDSLDDLNDTINDDNIGGATSDAGDFITGFDTNTFGLTSIITAPLNLIESLTSSSCSQLELPLPYLNNKKLILPCMTTIYQSTFGTLFTMYQTITFGIIAYWVCVRIFNMVKDFKNPDHDEVEVVDL